MPIEAKRSTISATAELLLNFAVCRDAARRSAGLLATADFTRATLDGACISRRLSVCLSEVGVLLKQLNVGSCKQRQTIAMSFVMPKISAKLKRGHPNGGAKCRRCRLNAAAIPTNWRLSTRSVVNLVRLQVYHTERPPYLFAACSP